MIAIIDYGAGNLRSVRNALLHLGVDVVTVTVPSQLNGAEKIVLPGVGAFGAGMRALREAGFEEPLQKAVAAGVPLLGICLGMQYLFETSEEMGLHQGLGFLPGKVVRFPKRPSYVVPHVGWNQLHIQRQSKLLAGIGEGAYTYFVHSYYVEASEADDVLAMTDYGLHYASVVGRDNVYGVQFHPEKSQAVGLRILRNFVEVVA